jgi:hypothetical protein
MRLRLTTTTLLFCLFGVSHLAAQEAIRNRSVRIIEEGTPIESIIPGREGATLAPSPKVQPSIVTPVQPNANAEVPANLPKETATASPAGPRPTATQPPSMTPPTLTAADRTYENSAGLKLELKPGTEITAGTRMSVQITTEKPGYLVVVDVDSEGHLTQIYPNTHTLATKEGAAPNANLLQKGKPRVIPDPKEMTTFQFVAAPPLGVGMLVAILSDAPVQMIDLPDVPAMMAGRKPALDYVRETTRQLKILPSSDREQIRDPQWSFATQFYVIK